jgi:hypothetical protein
LRRKYAALSLVVFIICVAAMLLRGRRTSRPQDEAGDAPRWNTAVSAPQASPLPKVEAAARGFATPAAANTQMTAVRPRDEGPLPWRAAPTPSGDAGYRPAVDASAGNRAFAGPTALAPTNPAANASILSTGNSVPEMASRYPGRDAVADRTAQTRSLPPTWPSGPQTDYRTAQRPAAPVAGPFTGGLPAAPSPVAAPNESQPAYNGSIFTRGADSSGQAHLMNQIGPPPAQPSYDPAGAQGYR